MSRYLDFFRTLKANPDDVILAALDGPSQPFTTVLATLNGFPFPSLCMVPDPMTCRPALDTSCKLSPEYFAQPTVRLNQVVSSVPRNNLISICDAHDAQELYRWLGGAIAARVMGLP